MNQWGEEKPDRNPTQELELWASPEERAIVRVRSGGFELVCGLLVYYFVSVACGSSLDNVVAIFYYII